MRNNPHVVDVDDGDDAFLRTRLAETALARQDLSLLTPEERGAIRAYAYNFFEQVNSALWNGGGRSLLVARYIDLIRSGLAKYPLPESVRVTREAAASDFDISDAESAYALVEEEFIHRGFMSTCGTAYPPRSIRHRPAVILDLIVPVGTPALRLGELAAIQTEREVLLIDARSYFISGVGWDEARNMWRIQGFVRET
ncbi:ADP-ribosyltransferase [Nocardia sp. IFM 10818]